MAKRTGRPSMPAEHAADRDRQYTVLARRYRPQQFDELVGQEHVAQALKNAIESNRVAHAYLFTGSRGVGKTSTARIFAKSLNCVEGPTVHPCDSCDCCRHIAAGEDVDVIEIDGASNRRIDEVREIRQNVQYRPSRGRFKIYIIDEVHMLTREAFNALLKTLEEPPPHVKFIFATTEVNKIPVTILSRCQRFDFGPIPPRAIAQQLGRIVELEARDAEDRALQIIARRAAGSMRDAESLLDQLLAFTEGPLTAERVNELLGTASDDQLCDISLAALRQETDRVLAAFGELAEAGPSMAEIADQLIQLWRDLLLMRLDRSHDAVIIDAENCNPELKQAIEAVSLDAHLACLDLLMAAKERMRFAGGHERTLMELTLIRLARIGQLASLEEILTAIEQGKPPGGGTRRAAREPAPRRDAAAQDKPPDPVRQTSLPEESQATELRDRVLASLPPLRRAELQKKCQFRFEPPNTLVIECAAQYNSLRERLLDDPKQIEALAGAASNALGKPCRIRVESKSEPPAKANCDEESPRKGRRSGTHAPRGREVELVREVLDLLDANIYKEDPDFAADSAVKEESGEE